MPPLVLANSTRHFRALHRRAPFAAHAASVDAMDDDLHIELRREAIGRLHVHVSGTATLDNTLAYWRAIVAAVKKQPASELLLIDELIGPLLTAQDWAALVAEVGPDLGNLRIAHVKPRGVGTVEHCVLAAMASGLEAQVFEDAHHASVWLRYSPDAR